MKFSNIHTSKEDLVVLKLKQCCVILFSPNVTHNSKVQTDKNIMSNQRWQESLRTSYSYFQTKQVFTIFELCSFKPTVKEVIEPTPHCERGHF